MLASSPENNDSLRHSVWFMSPTLQAGADEMRRIAVPVIGDVVTSAILETFDLSLIYILWRKRELARQFEGRTALVPPGMMVQLSMLR